MPIAMIFLIAVPLHVAQNIAILREQNQHNE